MAKYQKTSTRKPKSKFSRKQKKQNELQEVELLQSWIEACKPDSGSNPLSITLPDDIPAGRTGENSYSAYAGCERFDRLPLSQKTIDGLAAKKYTKMSAIQRATLPHSLCGRDVLGAAKTGSGKTLAFIIPVLEKLYRSRWGAEDGVGCIIISPTRELAAQLFEELRAVGKYHGFSAGLLIGGRKDVDTEKVCVNDLNILVCTPGRLLQHMDETPNFNCSELQVLVLDEADRILDIGFKADVNAIISQLPKQRQTLLFSATQTKSVQDLARLSLKDPEYLSVHAESVTATPKRLVQTAMIVPLEQKMDMLWSFLKAHLNAKILVFLSSCKQVKFVHEVFKKLRPGIPLKALHGRMKQGARMKIFFQFFEEKRSVLFSTDVASRGLDFPAVDWVVQMDCPEDVPAYIHRVGRTARFTSVGRSVLFLMPSEKNMITKLQEAKIPINIIKPNLQRLQPVTGLLAALLVKYPEMQYLAQRAFITYLKSIKVQSDKDVFDVSKLPIEEFSASLGLPMTPKVRFLSRKNIGKTEETKEASLYQENGVKTMLERADIFDGGSEQELENDILLAKDTPTDGGQNKVSVSSDTRVLKKKKLKINVDRPSGTRFVYDEEGNTLPPLAAFADTSSGIGVIDFDKIEERRRKLREEMKERDKEDKLIQKQRLREKRNKEKMKLKRGRLEEDDDEDSTTKKSKKMYFESESSDDDENGDKGNKRRRKDMGDFNADAVTLAEQEAIALKLLNSMH